MQSQEMLATIIMRLMKATDESSGGRINVFKGKHAIG
jgi:hypothetical protein